MDAFTFTLRWLVINCVLVSTGLMMMILVAPVCPHCEWFLNLLSLPMEEPLQISMF